MTFNFWMLYDEPNPTSVDEELATKLGVEADVLVSTVAGHWHGTGDEFNSMYILVSDLGPLVVIEFERLSTNVIVGSAKGVWQGAFGLEYVPSRSAAVFEAGRDSVGVLKEIASSAKRRIATYKVCEFCGALTAPENMFGKQEGKLCCQGCAQSDFGVVF